MRELVISMLSKNLPKTYYYHSLEHTLYIADKVVEIGEQEKCTKEEIDLLKTAALWHDTGFISTYAGHEEESCNLARKYLKKEFSYADADIEIICGMIEATKIPQSPKNKLEEIIADADLEYLGTDKAATVSNYLFKELKAIDNTLTEEAWNAIQIAFLQKHKYFTAYCKKYKEPRKLEYLSTLISNV